MHLPPPMLRVVWPFPVVSSTNRASPGPNWCTDPSPTPISMPPWMQMTYWRRGAGCQSMKWPESRSLKVMLVTFRGLFSSGWSARLCSSMCVWPSSPVYIR